MRKWCDYCTIAGMGKKDEPKDPLAAFVRATGFSDAEIGRRIGVNRWKISRARRGEYPLSIEEMVELEKLTNVPPSRWTDYFAAIVKARETDEEAGKKPAKRPFGASAGEPVA